MAISEVFTEANCSVSDPLGSVHSLCFYEQWERLLQKTYPDAAFWFACPKLDVVPAQALPYPGVLCGRPVLSVQNMDNVAKAFPAGSVTKAIPVQWCACVFPLGDAAEEKTFSLTLERGNNAPPFMHCSVPFLLPHYLQFLYKLTIIWWNPSWAGDDWENGAKNGPIPHLHSSYSINCRDFGRGDADLDMLVSVLPCTTFN